MAKRARNTTALMVVGTFLCVSSARASDRRLASGEAQSLKTSAGDSHIRSASRAIKAAIDYGIESSPTFRDLVRTIESSDSTVYLMEGNCGKNRRACFTDVTTAGEHRFLWLIISPDRATHDWDLVGSIGHELRHAVEVIKEPSVRSAGEKFGLYERIGIHVPGGGFETMAAMDAGIAVRDEVRKFDRQTKSK